MAMRQEERRAKTRSALLQAASAAFANRGYDGASIEAIAVSVGLSKGAVYAHFPSKLDLYLEVVSVLLEHAEARLERVSTAVRQGAGPLEASRRYLGAAGDAEHAALMAELWRAAAIDPQIRRVVERFVDERLGVLSAAAIDRGLTPSAALDFADTIARLIDAGMLYRRVDDATLQGAAS